MSEAVAYNHHSLARIRIDRMFFTARGSSHGHRMKQKGYNGQFVM